MATASGTITSAMLLVAAVIHLLPVSGVLGAKRLSTLYGIPFIDPNLLILMRHRAVLFGLIGTLLTYAAFDQPTQPIAFITGFLSVLSFLCLAHAERPYNTQVRRVVIADVVALVALLIGALCRGCP